MCVDYDILMRIIVLGATGVLGRRVVPLLVAQGHTVTAAGRSPQRLAQLGVLSTTIDLFDRASVARAIRGHSAVVHLSTHVPVGMRVFFPGALPDGDSGFLPTSPERWRT